MAPSTDTVIADFLCQHGGDDPEAVIRRLCHSLLEEAGANVPVDMRMFASFRGVSEINTVSQAEAGCIFFDGACLIIRTRLEDSERRRRFTIGHETCHTFFPGFREERRTRTDRTVGRFDRSTAEEYLCDVGAAELLLPRDAFLAQLPSHANLDVVTELAAQFDATVEATALRFAALHSGPTAVVILVPGWRKSEEQYMRRRLLQTDLLGTNHHHPSPRSYECAGRLATGGCPPFPGTNPWRRERPLAAVLGHGNVDYHGYTGLLPHEVTVSARHMPYRRDGHGELIDRVLVLLSGMQGAHPYEGAPH